MAVFVFSWPENHNMHHRTSTDSFFACRCSIAAFAFSWPENHNRHHRRFTESTPVHVRYLFLHSLGQKITTSHIDRVDSDSTPVEVRYLLLYSIGQKVTTCIIEYLPSRHQSMCDICFCILVDTKSQHASSHNDRVYATRCAISVFVISWPESHNHTTTESMPVDVRYLFLYSLGLKITTCIIAYLPSRHHSMCDGCFCILLARKSQDASSHIDRVDASRCAISVFVFSWPQNHNMHHHTTTE
jgi:hypothetical protein